MRGLCYIALFFSFFNSAYSQLLSSDTIGNNTTSGIYNKLLFEDSLASSFCITIKNEVKPHYHQHHSEHVIVLEGEGVMSLNGQTFTIKKGDVIFIPKQSIHSVKSTAEVPLKVLSIQSPKFDGRDRIMVK